MAVLEPYAGALVAIAELDPLSPPNLKPAGRGPFGTAPFEAAHGSSSRSPADQQDMKALGHKRQDPNTCVPVYPTGTQTANHPPLQGFGGEKAVWTTGSARLGQHLDRKRVADGHRLASDRQPWLGMKMVKIVAFNYFGKETPGRQGAISRDFGGLKKVHTSAPVPNPHPRRMVLVKDTSARSPTTARASTSDGWVAPKANRHLSH